MAVIHSDNVARSRDSSPLWYQRIYKYIVTLPSFSYGTHIELRIFAHPAVILSDDVALSRVFIPVVAPGNLQV